MQPDAFGEIQNSVYSSANARVFDMAFGDGRIETFGFDIESGVHRALAGRANCGPPVIE